MFLSEPTVPIKTACDWRNSTSHGATGPFVGSTDTSSLKQTACAALDQSPKATAMMRRARLVLARVLCVSISHSRSRSNIHMITSFIVCMEIE